MSDAAVDLIFQSWRPNTQKVYNTYIRKFEQFNASQVHSSDLPVHVIVANFLAHLAKSGASYSTVNSARSALSAYFRQEGSTVGQNDLVCRLVKGVFESNPSLPKYKETWDVDTVLEFLKTWPEPAKLSQRQLTLRLVMLLALVSGQRGQTLHQLRKDDVHLYDHKCVLVFSSCLKQTKPGRHLAPLELVVFEDSRLCVVSHLRQYLQLTEHLRKGDSLFISFQKPHSGVSRDTISRWLKIVLEEAGIDTCVFSSHSTRAASTSAALSRDIPIDAILKCAGWSQSSTFTKFYNKPVSGSGTTASFSQGLLDKYVLKK